MRAPWLAVLACLLARPAAAAQGSASTSPATTPDTPSADVRRLPTDQQRLTVDFDGLFERRRIRVLVPYSRTLYYNDQGHERGISAENVRGFEQWLDQKYRKKLKNRPLTVVIAPRTRDRLLPDLAAGFGDIAVGNLTVTAERLALVDFVSIPSWPVVKELVITRRGGMAVSSAEDLSGKAVHVRRSSSYFESLEDLNRSLDLDHRPPVKIVPVPDALEDEDLLEMVDGGILDAVVVDDWKARIWAQVLPNIQINEQAVLREGGQIGWAIRKDTPGLKAEVEAYLRVAASSGAVRDRLARYSKRIKLRNPTTATARKRFEQTIALFEKYGQRYGFDPLMLTAQGFQESRLNQEARSPVGAVGVMQVMPATGKELAVGDIKLTEPNIHAGAKYMDLLMSKYFSDADFDPVNRTLFAFASYNAGPGAISNMRKAAEKAGLDPNQWFNNVEIVTARKIGIETTTYVRNIYKYYVAYDLTEQTREAAEKARQDLESKVGQ